MKKILVSISVVLVLLLCETGARRWDYISTGQRNPGDALLGFIRGASNFTTSPQVHDILLHFDGTPGNNITFVHVSMFPSYHFARYLVLGQFDFFYMEIHSPDTTYLTAEMYVYGFPPSPGVKVEPMKPQHEPILTTVYNDKN
ncbi:hypothetical protein DMENIID0001_056680 [Sergentomyia squamirostris]